MAGRSSFANASISMIGPRAVFTTTAPAGSSDSSGNPSIPRVSGVSGACTDSTSACRSNSSSVRRPRDPQRQLRAVRAIRVEEHHAEPERLGPKATAVPIRPSPSDPEPLHAGSADQRVEHGFPGRRRLPPLPFMVQQQPPAKRQDQRDGVIGHLRGAVIRHVADHDLPLGRGFAVDAS